MAVLALTLVVLSVRGDSPTISSTTTILSASPTTTSSTSPPPTTTIEPTTVTTTAAQRLAEVEVLLRDLWFGWFDAIYRKDPDALWEVVATTRNYDAGLAAMDTMTFIEPPTLEGVVIEDLALLLDRSDCLVVEQTLDLSSFRGAGSIGSTVSVLWPDSRRTFRFATDWRLPNDLWLQDCDTLMREDTP